MLATIYLDRVARVAATAGVDTGILLGRAIAHDIGHLLLGSLRHGDAGLMQALWSRQMLERNTPDDWNFTSGKSRALRRRLGQQDMVVSAR